MLPAAYSTPVVSPQSSPRRPLVEALENENSLPPLPRSPAPTPTLAGGVFLLDVVAELRRENERLAADLGAQRCAILLLPALPSQQPLLTASPASRDAQRPQRVARARALGAPHARGPFTRRAAQGDDRAGAPAQGGLSVLQEPRAAAPRDQDDTHRLPGARSPKACARVLALTDAPTRPVWPLRLCF